MGRYRHRERASVLKQIKGGGGGEVLGDEFGEAVLALKEMLFSLFEICKKNYLFFLIYLVYSQSVFSAIKAHKHIHTK